VHVILARHARPEIVVDSPTVADPGLAELGVWQAARLADWLAFEEIDHVVTSPKRRAIETAQAVCDARGLSNEVVDDLDEIDRYCHSYYPTEILQTEGRALWDQVVAGNFTEVGWDTPEVFNARITAAWDDLCRRSPGERVLVSCHGGTVRAILASVAGNQQASFRTDYAAISRVQVTLDEDGTPHAHILSVNETGHFDADRTTAGGPMRGAPEMAWPGRRRSITTPR
jgi:probable phosphoglycerate mutase